jgi:hypothetical protein
LTVTVAGCDDVVVFELVPLVLDPPDEDPLPLELERRVVLERGAEYVPLPGAVAAGATTAGFVVAAARSAAEMESSVA